MGWSGLGELRYTTRWFTFFDLLGFTRLVENGEVEEIIETYERVVDELQRQSQDKSSIGVSSSWFSDTFILFSRGGSDHEFAAVETASRLFFQQLIIRDIPVRGALTYGKLYSKVDKNVFVGPALIEAYRYCEDQDWLGFILTPSVFERCRDTQIDLERRAHYRAIGESTVLRRLSPENVYAFAFNNGIVRGRNPYLDHIRHMRQSAGPEHRAKYDNTEAFVLKHSRVRRSA
jgi:hypothetical protein